MKEEAIKQENTETGFRLPNKKLFLVIVAVAAAVLIGIGFWMSGNKELVSQLDLGQKYIEECDYEQAIVAFNRAIEIDERCAEAYIGLAETYIRMGEFDKALEVAKKGYEMTGDTGLQEYIDMIESGNISRSDGKWMKRIVYNEAGALVYSHVVTYDKENREDSISHYDSAGNLVRKIDLVYDADGNRLVTYYYNSDGTLTKVDYTYENGVLRSIKGDDGSWSVYDYEEDGRRGKITCGKGQNVGAEEEITGYNVDELDEKGNLIRREFYNRDFRLFCYDTYEYNEDGKQKLRTTYDEDGNMSCYEIYEYDENGKRTGSYQYDADGNLTRQTKYE